MHSFTTFAVVSQALLLGASAQNNTDSSRNSTKTCSDIGSAVQYNSSSTRTISAVKLSGPRPTVAGISERFGFDADSSHSWELSLRVQKQPQQAGASTGALGPGPYRQVMFLDTGYSNMTDIGSCHQTIQSETGAGSFQWTKETMELSIEDSGDCVTLLGNKCVEALKKKAQENAALFPLRNGRCQDMNSSMPEECSGVGPQLIDRQMNLTYLSGVSEGHLNSQLDPSLECNGINVSSTHSVTVAERMAYDAAVRFPVIDVITFWPNRSLPNGLQSYDTRWPSEVLVEVVCMRPDENIAEGSETPASAAEILARNESRFPIANGASSLGLGYGIVGLMSAAIMGIMLII